MVSRIKLLLEEIIRNPHAGIGKPEPLRHAFRGYGLRLIDSEHRLIDRAVVGTILIAQLRFRDEG